MNMVKATYVGLLLMFLAATSCSKKDAAPVVQPCAVTKTTVTMTFSNGAVNVNTTTYEYNADLTLAQATLVYTYTLSGAAPVSTTTVTKYTYSGGALASASAGTAQTTWTNTGGAVTKISGSGGTTPPIVLVTEDFTYDAQGKLSLITYQDNLGVGTKLITNLAFDASANLQTYKREIILGGVSQGLLPNSYTFDTKNNPYSLLAKAIKQPYFHSGVFGEPNETYYSKNNIMASNSGTSFPTTYTYEYSEAGYPTKMVQTSLGITTTTLFEYQLCK